MKGKGVVTGMACLGAAASIAAGGTAMAQGLGVVGGARDYIERNPLTLQVGGGVEALSEQGAGDVTGTGGLWTVRAAVGQNSVLGGEASYLGSAQSYSQSGVGDGTLLRNGVEALVRLGYPVQLNRGFLTPYAAGGLGWSLFSLTGVDAGGINKNDGVFTIPFGGGLVFGYDRYSFDVRAIYRPAFGDTMFSNVNSSIYTAGLNSYGVTAALGYTF